MNIKRILIACSLLMTSCAPAASVAQPATPSNGGIVGKTESYQIRLFVSQGYGKCFVLEDKKGEPKFLQCD